jgi:hypothetical protein
MNLNHPKSGFERTRSVRPVLARREEATGSPPARTSKEASAGRAIARAAASSKR